MGARYLPEQQLEGKSQVSWKAVKTLNLIFSFWWTSECNHFCRTHDEFLLFYITGQFESVCLSPSPEIKLIVGEKISMGFTMKD